MEDAPTKIDERPWASDKPVGSGVVYTPTPESRQQYAAACQEAIIEARAARVANEPSPTKRKALINETPESYRDAVRSRSRRLAKAS